MKQRILSVLLLCMGVAALTSCQKDVEIWDSATLEYSGRYVVKFIDAQGESTDYDGSEVYIYNTVNNVANELWIEDKGHHIPLKSKFTLNGSPESFVSTQKDFGQLTDNLLAITLPTAAEKIAAPTKAGETATVSREAVRAYITEGKITRGTVTTKGGNIADGITLKLTLLGGKVTFKSVQKPKGEWANPNVPEFAWKFDSVAPDTTKDTTVTIEGYSYTGYPEDLY